MDCWALSDTLSQYQSAVAVNDLLTTRAQGWMISEWSSCSVARIHSTAARAVQLYADSSTVTLIGKGLDGTSGVNLDSRCLMLDLDEGSRNGREICVDTGAVRIHKDAQVCRMQRCYTVCSLCRDGRRPESGPMLQMQERSVI